MGKLNVLAEHAKNASFALISSVQMALFHICVFCAFLAELF